MRTRGAALVIAGILGCLAGSAHADPRSDIVAKARAAMASYDAMDYEAARKQLNQALAIAKKAKLDRDPVVARVYLDLAITQLAGSDPEAARVALLSAAQIDPKIAIDPAYKSPELVRLLEEARAAASGSADGDDDCKAVRGLQHTPVEAARPGAPQPVEALIGADLAPARVVAMYRPEGAIDFTELRLTRQGSCRYTGAIPSSAMRGNLVHYYIAAYDAGNKVLASKGSSGAPSSIVLARPAPPSVAPTGRDGTGDPEDPIHPPDGVSGSAAPASAPRVMIAVTGGTSFGYVTGKTEAENVVQKCCIGSSPFVIAGEVGYYANPRLSIGVAARIGFPIGANIAGHSTTAPAGFVRVRYALSRSRNGFRAMAELGAGLLRNTIKLDGPAPGMDTDIVAQGPVLVGAGIGYRRHLADSIALFIDLDAMAGIAVVDKVGSALHLNSGISADLNLGLAVGF